MVSYENQMKKKIAGRQFSHPCSIPIDWINSDSNLEVQTKMADAEINSLVGKFLSLWYCGKDVTLKFQSKKGKAYVVMELELSEKQEDNTVEFNFKEYFSQQNRLRRRDKRLQVPKMSVTMKFQMMSILK